MAIPQSTISSLSSGEFVGMVADDPQRKIRLKKFHCEIVNNKLSKKEKRTEFKQLPQMQVDKKIILGNYLHIKKDIRYIIETEMERILNDPLSIGLIVKKS